jgi:hypothetical protein
MLDPPVFLRPVKEFAGLDSGCSFSVTIVPLVSRTAYPRTVASSGYS